MNNKMNKKGFTLIELIAAVILVIMLATVTVPKVLDVIDNTRANAYYASMLTIVSSASNYHAMILGDSVLESQLDGKTNLLSKLDYSGEGPDSGTLYMNYKGEVKTALVYQNRCFTKDYSDVDLEIRMFDDDFLEVDCVVPE